jgi:hypothetical protein
MYMIRHLNKQILARLGSKQDSRHINMIFGQVQLHLLKASLYLSYLFTFNMGPFVREVKTAGSLTCT